MKSKKQILDAYADDYSPFVELGQRYGADALDDILDVLNKHSSTEGYLYVPKKNKFWKKLERPLRDQEIYAAFTGNNTHELAKQYGLSERQVRNIVEKKGTNFKAAA